MFATKAPIYNDDVIDRQRPPGRPRHYDTSAPLYREIKALVRAAGGNPALADGAQVHRYASDAAGIFAFSRIDARPGASTSSSPTTRRPPKTATFSDLLGRLRVRAPLGAAADLRAADGRVTVTVPPLSVAVYRANRTMAQPKSAPGDLPDVAERRWRRGRPCGDRRGPARQHVRRGDLPPAPGRHVRLDADRHRRQRPVPRLPRRVRTRQGHAGRVPNGREGPRRTRVGDVHLRHRRRADDRREQREWRRRPGHPARQRQSSRAATTPRWAAPATGSRTAPRRSWPSTPRTTIWKGTFRLDPGRRLRVQGRDQQVVGRELRRGWRHRAAATSPTPRPAASR